jgi:enoyl-CoA hydratase/carnithine racemase
VALMDGIVMGGGMGISQGASVRVVTERSKMAMPETNIGLFPDVGGGYFLSRCPGHLGEYLGLTGHMLQGEEAVHAGLADGCISSGKLPHLWQTLIETPFENGEAVERWVATQFERLQKTGLDHRAEMDATFAQASVVEILERLELAADEWARHTAQTLRTRSPLMLHVVLEQIRRARTLSLADDLRMERDLVRHCFALRPVAHSETVEGIRALAVDKDHQPKWQPARAEDVNASEVAAFFVSPWPPQAHPLRELR